MKRRNKTKDEGFERSLLLGEDIETPTHYSPNLLFAIERAFARAKIITNNALPFDGVDIWNAYEFSWLNNFNKPEIAFLQISFPCTSKYLIESKSLKLYLHSFNETNFSSKEEVKNLLQQDLSKLTESPVTINIYELSEVEYSLQHHPEGETIDHLEIKCEKNIIKPIQLSTTEEIVEETLFSDLLKSNCPVTNQPDWGSVVINYKGAKINRESLLRYIISYRYHQGFHEDCVEKIFIDILNQCKPISLTVSAHYTRRGGLDINPYRSNCNKKPFSLKRLIRQ